jgi:hypothetical protein
MAQGRRELSSILGDVGAGVLTLDQACEIAGERAAAGAFELVMLAGEAQDAVERGPTDPLRAWRLGRIVAAAARGAHRVAAGDQEQGSGIVLATADFHLISEATALLSKAGDIRVFTVATEAAQEALDLATELEFPEERGAILQRRGMMLLACYGRGPADLHAQAFQDWIAAGFDANPDLELTLAVADFEDGPRRRQGLRWPKPLEALALAESDLRAALPLVAARRRGPVLKALSDVLNWRELLGGPPAGAELVETCRMALDALDALAPEQQPLRLVVQETLARALGQAAASDTSAVTRATETEALAARLESDWDTVAGQPLAWDTVTLASSAFEKTDPARALRLLALQQQLPAQWADEQQRIEHYATTLVLVGRMSAPERLWPVLESPQEFTSISGEILASAAGGQAGSADGSLRREQLGGALTLVVVAGNRFDRDDEGLGALALLRDAAPELISGYREAYKYTEGQMLLGQGFREEQAGNHVAAAKYFLLAADAAADAETGGEVIRAVQCIRSLIEGDEALSLPEAAAWCAAHALRLELSAPQSGPATLQDLFRILLARLVRDEGSVAGIFSLLQAAKGRRMAAMLAVGTSGWSPDNQTRHLLQQETEQVRNLPADRPLLQPLDGTLADIELMVAAYTSDYETSPAGTPGGALANLRRAIERKIAASAISGENAPPPAALQDVLAALDKRTALLTLYEGEWEGTAATFGMLISHTTCCVAVSASDLPYRLETFVLSRNPGEHEGYAPAQGQIAIPPMGHVLSGVRRTVQEEPAPRDLAPEAEEELAALAGWALEAVYRERASLLAAGIDRLIIVPHAAYHFAPLHLAGPPGKPIADDFLVTYLLSPDQLIRTKPPVSPRSTRAAVFALSYADQPQLPYLESSAAEGTLLGSVLGVQPALDADATKTAVVAALENARWVHLCAHGALDPDAPMFQTVFLSAAGEDDGRLLAHEVASLNLRGLELVTLGACETSLGRVDISGNLRGLPAAFLTAGANAVIGTLWQVTDTASTVFFTALYRSLTQEGATVIEAFGTAQREARQQCPEYRDWGAFYLTGGYGVLGNLR